MLGSLVLAFVAGVLSILSPCVLPLVPLVLGTASSEHRLGPAALAAGLALSFVTIGLFVATIGFSAGLTLDVFRSVAAVLMVAVGAVLLVPALQMRLAMAGGPIATWADQRFGRDRRGGLAGQFWLGMLLGAVWSPCVGPTLGAASLLAAQGKDLPQVAATMLAFGVGAALPLLALGQVSREAFIRRRDRVLAAGRTVKAVFGGLLVAVGILVLTGYDKAIEAALVEASPRWLTELTTRF